MMLRTTVLFYLLDMIQACLDDARQALLSVMYRSVVFGV